MRAVGLETGWEEKRPATLKVEITPERTQICVCVCGGGGDWC